MFIASLASLALLAVPVPGPAQPTHYQGRQVQSAPTSCASVNKTYPYGVGIKGSKDKVKTGFSPIKNFKAVSKTKFKSFAKFDSDKDKIACELPKYKNCTKLNTVYKNGLGLKGAKDKTTGEPVTSFKVVSTALYTTNTHLDRDKDKISCEKK